jgi:hypothetical protein
VTTDGVTAEARAPMPSAKLPTDVNAEMARNAAPINFDFMMFPSVRYETRVTHFFNGIPAAKEGRSADEPEMACLEWQVGVATQEIGGHFGDAVFLLLKQSSEN